MMILEVLHRMRNNSIQSQLRGNLIANPTRSSGRWRSQSGITTLGFLILVVFIGMFGYAGLRLTPIFLNYVAIASVVNGVQKEYDGQNPTRSEIKKSISRRFDVESISMITARDVKVSADSGGFLVAIVYDHQAPFIANVSFSVHFDKQVMVRR